MIGIFSCGKSPSITCRSVRQMAQQRTRIRTSPGPGSGVGKSAISNGAESIGAMRRNSMAFMAAGNLRACGDADSVNYIVCRRTNMPPCPGAAAARQ